MSKSATAPRRAVPATTLAHTAAALRRDSTVLLAHLEQNQLLDVPHVRDLADTLASALYALDRAVEAHR